MQQLEYKTISGGNDKIMKKNSIENEPMKRKKSCGLLIAGAVMLTAGIILAVYTYNTSYQESLTATEEKLRLQRPYSYSLTLVFLAIPLTVKGIRNAVFGVYRSDKADVKRLAMAGLMAALCYIGFAFFKIDLTVGPERTSFHFGNVFCVLGALLLGGYWGGLAGAVGMTIGDFTTSYVTSAPKTFLLKLFIGLIVGFAAHKIFKLDKEHSAKYVTGATVLSCVCGMAFNVAADPLVGYFYKTYLLGIPQDITKALVKIAALTTTVNAVIAVIAASAFYLALRPALKKAGLFVQVTPGTETK